MKRSLNQQSFPWATLALLSGTLLLLSAALAPRDKLISSVLSMFNANITEHLQQLHPAVRDRFARLIHAWQQAGWKVIITSSYRSLDKQRRIARSSPVAAQGLSWHNFGMAIDVNLLKGVTWLRMASPKATWLASGVVDTAKQMGFRWGGDFSNYDPVHFDTGNDFDRQKLYATALQQFGNDPDNFKGNQVLIA
ncbi:MAG: hypothetical protein KatS3mg031_0191 [Chitinophagales bacterium]|nr:MAG: hypothetical protein KatS3mg031_0191 [Chitinophagales bacterium]